MALAKPRLPRSALRDARGHGVWLRPGPGTTGYGCFVPESLSQAPMEPKLRLLIVSDNTQYSVPRHITAVCICACVRTFDHTTCGFASHITTTRKEHLVIRHCRASGHRDADCFVQNELLVQTSSCTLHGNVRPDTHSGRIRTHETIKVVVVRVRLGPGFRACGNEGSLSKLASVCTIQSYTCHLA